jgi:hypothetical protein
MTNPDTNNSIILVLIKSLPLEIESIIKSFLPINILLTLNKEYYIKYHKDIKKIVSKNQYDNYIRDMLRKDNDFVFKLLIHENYKIWININKYKYNKTIYGNYFCFIDKFCIDNESTKCRNLLKDFLNKTGLSKNRHKKNTITNIIWTN